MTATGASFCNSNKLRQALAAVWLGVTAALPSSVLAAPGDAPTRLVITPDRFPSSSEIAGGNLSVMGAEDIARRNLSQVGDVLATLPGVSIARAGGPGQIRRVFLRGTSSSHVLVLVDGVAVNDPSSPDNAFDFAHLSTDNIERIELLRGAQSVLYGSDAIGGVIQIFTRKGDGAPQVRLRTEAGNHGTANIAATLSGSSDATRYSVGFARRHSAGVSAVAARFGGHERDGDDQSVFSSRLDRQVSDALALYIVARAEESRTEYDNAFPLQDADFEARAQSWLGRAGAALSAWDGAWVQEWALSHQRLQRKNLDDFPRRSAGERTQLEWLHHIIALQQHRITFGVESAWDRFATRSDFGPADAAARNVGLFAQDQWQPVKRLALTAGARLDRHDAFGAQPAWRLGAHYALPEGVRLTASYGTGFKAPSLFALYDAYYGNAALQPERSRGYDIGIESNMVWLGHSITLGATYFDIRIRDEIEADPVTFRAINRGITQTRGVESRVDIGLWGDAALRLSHALTQAEDARSGEQLPRRPRQRFGIEFEEGFSQEGNVILGFDYAGARRDVSSGGGVRLPSYVTAHASAQWHIGEQMTLYGRADNLFDRNYEEVYGYEAPGFSAILGIEMQF